MTNSVCLFGGTFNPVHNGHLITGAFLLNKMDFKKIIFIPNYIPPHRKLPSVSAEERFEMLRIALKDEKRMEDSDYEIRSGKKSYFINTVGHFKEKYNDLSMVIGTDQANSFRMWYRWKEYFDLLKILVIEKDEPLYETLDFEFVRTPRIECSSTEIRDLLKNNRTVSGYLPESVIEYIYEKNLYT